MNVKNLAVVHVQYDHSKYPDSFPYIVGQLNKLSCEKKYFIIDNKRIKKKHEIFDNVHMLPGDNSNWEFSGWQKGLDYIRKNIDCDLILFTNDSLNSHYNHRMLESKRLEYFFEDVFLNKRFCGKLDKQTSGESRLKSMSFMGYNVDSWICSNCFAAPKCILKNFDIDYSHTYNVEEICKSLECFMNHPLLNKNLKDHVYNWLSYHWHNKFDIESNLKLFKHKTKSILNEKLLTAKIREKEITILNSFDEMIYK